MYLSTFDHFWKNYHKSFSLTATWSNGFEQNHSLLTLYVSPDFNSKKLPAIAWQISHFVGQFFVELDNL